MGKVGGLVNSNTVRSVAVIISLLLADALYKPLIITELHTVDYRARTVYVTT